MQPETALHAGSGPAWSTCPAPAHPGHCRPNSYPHGPSMQWTTQALGGLSCEGPGPHRSHACLRFTDRRKSAKAALDSGWKEMGTLPRGSNCLPWLFQAFSAPLGTHAPQAAWSPSSAPQGPNKALAFPSPWWWEASSALSISACQVGCHSVSLLRWGSLSVP